MRELLIQTVKIKEKSIREANLSMSFERGIGCHGR